MILHPQMKKHSPSILAGCGESAFSFFAFGVSSRPVFLYHASPFDVLTLGSRSPLVRST